MREPAPLQPFVLSPLLAQNGDDLAVDHEPTFLPPITYASCAPRSPACHHTPLMLAQNRPPATQKPSRLRSVDVKLLNPETPARPISRQQNVSNRANVNSDWPGLPYPQHWSGAARHNARPAHAANTPAIGSPMPSAFHPTRTHVLILFESASPALDLPPYHHARLLCPTVSRTLRWLLDAVPAPAPGAYFCAARAMAGPAFAMSA